LPAFAGRRGGPLSAFDATVSGTPRVVGGRRSAAVANNKDGVIRIVAAVPTRRRDYLEGAWVETGSPPGTVPATPSL
jgi:hypothetical protein